MCSVLLVLPNTCVCRRHWISSASAMCACSVLRKWLERRCVWSARGYVCALVSGKIIAMSTGAFINEYLNTLSLGQQESFWF